MTRRLLKFTGFLVFFLLAAGFGGMTYFHYGNPQNTCASCHEMTGVHAAWSTSAHRNFHCRNCHGGSLTLDVHALRSHLDRVVQHVAGMPAEQIRLSEEHVLSVHAACRNCHPRQFADWQASRHSATYARIFLDPVHNTTEMLSPDCLRCHGMFSDGNIEDLVTPTSTTGPWSLKDPVKAGQPAIPCLACHQVHTPAAGSTTRPEAKAAQLYVRHELAYFPTDMLPVTPIWQGERAVKLSPDPCQRLCVQCHSPDAFRQLGSSDDRTPAGVHEGLNCSACHNSHSNSAKASCSICHPASSHCGRDVEKMDTTFGVPTSKHNIHTVACADCHDGKRPGK
ncbi:MAG: multiheme c-type cytochrome [Tepidisphaeraceae bacterium]|jgi:hypothetical protein